MIISRRALPFHPVAVSGSRVLVIAVVASVAIAAGGLIWSGARFGWQPTDRASRLQQQLTRRVADRVATVKTAAEAAAQHGELVAAALSSRDRVRELFTRLNALHPDPDAASVTIWVPAGARPDHRPLAWTEGPSENVGPGKLEQAPTLFVDMGAGGLRLFYLQPILHNERRIGVAVAEVLLSAASTDGAFDRAPLIDSLAGHVRVEPLGTPAGTGGVEALTIGAPDGTPLFDVHVSQAQQDAALRTFRWRVLAVALIPWLLVVAHLLAAALRRRREANTPVRWLIWTAAIAAGVAGVTLGVNAVLRAAGVAVVWTDAVSALAALGIAGLAGGDALRRVTPRHAGRAPVQFVAEQLLAGAILAAGVGVTEWLWQHRVNPASIEQWHLPVLPSSIPVALALLTLLVSQVATAWFAASALGMMAARWRITRTPARLFLSAALWFVPPLLWLVVFPPHSNWPVSYTHLTLPTILRV